ncbi:MAG: flavoprotein [bacterium]|nr:flavoprotein [bacterium]
MKNKSIILGISGGIATYKVCDLARKLVKMDFTVHTVMTENAAQFVTPLTFKTLTGNPVFLRSFEETSRYSMPHISLSQIGRLMVLAPATANIIAKIAHGLADDLLSTLCLSFPHKIILAPSMNHHMYRNPVFQNNLALLRKYRDKYIIIDAEKGDLACGEEGEGRLADLQKIIRAVENEIK